MSFYLLIYFGDQLFKCCHTKDLISWGTKAELVIEYALYIRLLLISDASVLSQVVMCQLRKNEPIDIVLIQNSSDCKIVDI